MVLTIYKWKLITLTFKRTTLSSLGVSQGGRHRFCFATSATCLKSLTIRSPTCTFLTTANITSGENTQGTHKPKDGMSTLKTGAFY